MGCGGGFCNSNECYRCTHIASLKMQKEGRGYEESCGETIMCTMNHQRKTHTETYTSKEFEDLICKCHSECCVPAVEGGDRQVSSVFTEILFA